LEFFAINSFRLNYGFGAPAHDTLTGFAGSPCRFSCAGDEFSILDSLYRSDDFDAGLGWDDDCGSV
jgi:hypothetical protein